MEATTEGFKVLSATPRWATVRVYNGTRQPAPSVRDGYSAARLLCNVCGTTFNAARSLRSGVRGTFFQGHLSGGSVAHAVCPKCEQIASVDLSMPAS